MNESLNNEVDIHQKYNQLFELITNLWDNAENKKEFVDKCYKYWNGEYKAPPQMYFDDQEKTAFNIIKPIIESKLSAMLDARFTTEVVPKLNTFSTTETLKIQQAVADIYNQELKNILNQNRFYDTQERVARWGEICGFGCSQVTIESDENPEGVIKINEVDPRNLRWNKNAKTKNGLTFLAYEKEVSPQILKNKYAYDNNGVLNQEMSDKIDLITETVGESKKGRQKGVVAITTEQTNNLAYTYESQGIQAGQICKVIVMFMLDGSVYAPEKNDSQENKDFKQEQREMFPNGRMIIFSANKDAKLILKSRPAPEGFKSLGNIDFFNPIDFDSFIGKSEVEDLIPSQDRVNGTLLKARSLIANQLSVVILDKLKFPNIKAGALVNQPVIFSDGPIGEYPQVIDNGNVAKAMQLIEYVGTIYDQAKEMARVNDTMINGMRQKGTTSAAQVEAYQESPMSSIRAMQRNFKDYVISTSEKVINLIQNYYTINRIVKLSTGDYKYARFGQDEEGNYIELINDAFKVADTIKINPKWQFCVEVVAGTEIPRNRRETAQIAEVYYDKGLLGDPQDIDTKELLLKSQDIPNYREIIANMRKKQDIKAQNPPSVNIQDILMSPDLSKSFADIIKSLQYNSTARGQILESVGLIGAVDKLDTAPAQTVFSKANVSDVAVTVPDIISDKPDNKDRGEVVSAALIDQQKEGKNNNAI